MVGTRVVHALQILGLYNFVREVENRRLHGRRLDFYGQFVAQGNLCFDVGANIGNRTDIFLALGARVVAVEPQRSCVTYLERKYRGNSNVAVIAKGLDSTKGLRTIKIPDSGDGASTMSEEWLERIQKSRRFGNMRWLGSEIVEVTTLDELISRFGCPAFCKIDVEGYELQVLGGLSTPIPVVSFEFTPEMIGVSLEAIKRLERLGKYLFNYSLGESMKLELEAWLSPSDTFPKLSTLSQQTAFGDIYAKLQE